MAMVSPDKETLKLSVMLWVLCVSRVNVLVQLIH